MFTQNIFQAAIAPKDLFETALKVKVRAGSHTVNELVNNYATHWNTLLRRQTGPRVQLLEMIVVKRKTFLTYSCLSRGLRTVAWWKGSKYEYSIDFSIFCLTTRTHVHDIVVMARCQRAMKEAFLTL